MQKQLTYLYIIIKRIFKNPILIGLLLCIPAAAFISTKVSAFSTATEQKIGVYFKEKTEYTEGFMDELEKDSYVYEFVHYTSKDDMLNDILSGKLECGYIFRREFEEGMKSGKYNKLIDVMMSPSTTFGTSINEVMNSVILKYLGYSILESELNDTLESFAGNEEILEYMYERYTYYCDSEETFHIVTETIDSDKNSRSDENKGYVFEFPLRGMLAILTFLAGMMGTLILAGDTERQIFAAHKKDFTTSAVLFYLLVPTVIFTVISELALMVSGNTYEFIKELLFFFRYIIICFAFDYVVFILLKKRTRILPIVPVEVLGSMIFCPIFVDVENIAPFFSLISYLFIPGYFI